MKLLIVTIFLGNLIPTSYRSVPAQTKPTDCEWTASGEKCNVHGVAVSRDLLKRWGGPLEFGDLIYIDGIGFKFVNDVMNARHKQRVDVWVSTALEERQFEKKWKQKPLKVYLIKTGGYSAASKKILR